MNRWGEYSRPLKHHVLQFGSLLIIFAAINVLFLTLFLLSASNSHRIYWVPLCHFHNWYVLFRFSSLVPTVSCLYHCSSLLCSCFWPASFKWPEARVILLNYISYKRLMHSPLHSHNANLSILEDLP